MLRSRIPQIMASLEPRVDGALRVSAELIQERAAARAPRDSGDLADAIHVEEVPEGGYAVVAGDDTAFYGTFVEFGTTRRAPQPFLMPAAEESVEEVEDLVSAALRTI